jgi:glutathione-regulated potassium-efflux system ancillary protein KefF
MSKVVIISGHPDLEASYTNKIILEEAAKGISSVDIRRLDTLYPDYRIDVEAEQAALVTADVIVLQYPFYWYSTPALMKKWVDDVLAGGFAQPATQGRQRVHHIVRRHGDLQNIINQSNL